MLQVLRREDGQGLAEYALILALIAIVVIGAVTLLGVNLLAQLNNIAHLVGLTI